MDDLEKEQLERIKFMIDDGYGIPHEDLNFMHHLIIRLDKEIDMMSDKLTTDYHSKDWVKKYYAEEAQSKLEKGE